MKIKLNLIIFLKLIFYKQNKNANSVKKKGRGGGILNKLMTKEASAYIKMIQLTVV